MYLHASFCKILCVHEGQTHLKTQTDLLLIEDLHGIMLSCFSVLHQHHTAKRTRAQGFQPLKLLQTSRVLDRQNKNSLLNFCKRGTYLYYIIFTMAYLTHILINSLNMFNIGLYIYRW